MSGVLLMATADEQTFRRFNSMSAIEISTTYVRTGSRSFKVVGTYAEMSAYFDPSPSELYVRVAVLRPQTAGGDKFEINVSEVVSGNIVNHMSCIWNLGAGGVEIRRGSSTSGTILATASLPCTMDTWYCVEMYFKVHDTLGAFTMKVNGVEVTDLTLTNVDTLYSGTGVIQRFRVVPSPILYLSDIMARDDQWCGQKGIHMKLIDGDGADTDFTPSAGSAWECVDEIPPTFTDWIDGDATVPATKATFLTNEIDGKYINISAVAAVNAARLDAVGTGSARAIIKSATAYANGPSVALDVSEQVVVGYFTVDPNTSGAFTNESVNALEVGIEVV